MGVFWSYGINCDKKLIKKLIDNENWFDATLIEYSNSSLMNKNDWNFTLPRSSKKANIKLNVVYSRNLFQKARKCFGRITVQDDCIIFQGVNCNELLRAVVTHQDKSPISADSDFSDLPDHIVLYNNRSLCHSASSASTTSGGNDNEIVPADRLHTFVWPIETVRQFGFKDNFFSFESGRYSSTGEGGFTFKIKKLVLFLSIFQTAKDRLYYTKAKPKINGKNNQSCQLSPEYYNLKPSDSYHISKSALTCDLNKMKPVSKSSEYFFNTYGIVSETTREQNYQNLISPPIKYCKIDFSDSYLNSQSIPNMRRRTKSNVMLSNTGDSIHYLTICENQTKAVEKVLQRIG